ncbi:MAG: hypothetical protein CMJ75_11630 [Planctomycetaceae bacterium]|nr:hypothetical protein [Planctomycetaceae bacterium]
MSQRRVDFIVLFTAASLLMVCTRSFAAPTGAFFVNSLGMKMIVVKAQSFGAWTPSFADYKKAAVEVSGALERPPVAHRVKLPVDFCLAEFPVTNGIYRQFLKETGHREPGGELFDMDRIKIGDVATWKAAGVNTGVGSAFKLAGFRRDDHAVAGVNYHDAIAFCKWLSKKEGRTYRLPEVYEWEYACRAGQNTLFHWGNRADPRFMNYAGSRIGHPTPVGMYPANPWGFSDMHGNVAECCEQIGRPGGVQKGGAWNYPASLLGADVYVDVRGTFTPHMPITRRTLGTGFRLACDASEARARTTDLAKPTIVAVSGAGPALAELEIKVGKKIDLGKFPGGGVNLLVTKAGRWIINAKRSDDQGRSWHVCDELWYNRAQLRDGTIITINGPGVVTKGRGTLQLRRSTDNWQTTKTIAAVVHIPAAKRFWAYGGLIELEDGTLLTSLYGWFDGDQVREENPLFPIADEAYKTRVIAIRSTDRGKSWEYLSTICYHPEKGREGANEATMVQLPSGDLFVAMRTGLHGYRDKLDRTRLDEPLLVTWSRCNGRKWAEPARIYVDNQVVTGIWPTAVVTEGGVLAVIRGRPDGSVVFNPDGTGTIWTNEVRCEATGNASGMDSLALIGPNTVLATYIDHYDWQGDGQSRVIGLPITITKNPIAHQP